MTRCDVVEPRARAARHRGAWPGPGRALAVSSLLLLSACIAEPLRAQQAASLTDPAGARRAVVVPSPTRVGVLPFQAEPGADPDLARGIAAELAEHLAYAPDITVRSPGSVEWSGVPALDALALDYLVRATLVESAGRLRLRTRIEGRGAGAGEVLEWTSSPDRIVDLPRGLARDVLGAIGRLAADGPAAYTGPPAPADPAAYTLYLRARGAAGGTLADGQSAVRALERVAAVEPEFAPSHAALGHHHLSRGGNDLSSRIEAYDRAERSFRKALALQPDLASAIVGLANLYSRTPRQAEAATLLRAAVVVHPNRPELHSRLGYVLRYAGLFDESMAAYRRALELDNRPGNLVEWEGQIAKSLVYHGDFAGALALQEGLHEHLARMRAYADEKLLFYQGVMHFYAGDHAAAVEFFDASWSTDSSTVWSLFGRAYRAAAVGDTARLLELARTLQSHDVADGERHYRLVHFHALAGRAEEAAGRLRTALTAGFFAYPYIVADPLTAAVRGHPAYAAVLDEVRSKHEAFRDEWDGPPGRPRRDDDAALDEALFETVVRIPVMLEPGPDGAQRTTLLIGTTYRPPGEGPFPLIVLSHGSPADAERRARMGRFRRLPAVRALVDRGFAVIVPMRRGFGDSGGDFAERVGPCNDPDFLGAGRQAARDLLATVAFAANLPYVQRDRIVLMGQSAGGYASIAAASLQPPGVVAAVNMAGGRAGRGGRFQGESCSPERMAETLGHLAQTIRIPILWHYAENDQYFGPHHVRNWFRAYTAAGGRGRLVMRPPFGEDGHRMFASPDGMHLWTSSLDEFLEEIGFW